MEILGRQGQQGILAFAPGTTLHQHARPLLVNPLGRQLHLCFVHTLASSPTVVRPPQDARASAHPACPSLGPTQGGLPSQGLCLSSLPRHPAFPRQPLARGGAQGRQNRPRGLQPVRSPVPHRAARAGTAAGGCAHPSLLAPHCPATPTSRLWLYRPHHSTDLISAEHHLVPGIELPPCCAWQNGPQSQRCQIGTKTGVLWGGYSRDPGGPIPTGQEPSWREIKNGGRDQRCEAPGSRTGWSQGGPSMPCGGAGLFLEMGVPQKKGGCSTPASSDVRRTHALPCLAVPAIHTV